MRSTPLRKKFGVRLRAIRKQAGLSQEKLGFVSGIHRTYIGAVERGEQNISIDNIYRLTLALKVPAKQFFD